jgi:hypothetical protein
MLVASIPIVSAGPAATPNHINRVLRASVVEGSVHHHAVL